MDFPKVTGFPSCVNLTTWVQGQSDYELLCQVIQVVNQLSELAALSVITYANPIDWDITTQYSQNTVVVDPKDGTAYLSVQPVPLGVQISNTDYWTPIFSLETLITFLKRAITVGQQEIGAGATQEIPAQSVFWASDTLVYTPQVIPIGTIIIPGSNCYQVSVVDLINEVYNTPYAVYNPSDTSIELGWVRTGPSSPVVDAVGDTHIYSQPEQKIIIKAAR